MRNLRLSVLIASLVLVIVGCNRPNHAPVVQSIEVSPANVQTNSQVTLTALATDEDGDALSYAWYASSGSFPSGSKDRSVTWTSPSAAGNVDVTVSVADWGREVNRSTTIAVAQDNDEFEYAQEIALGAQVQDRVDDKAVANWYKFTTTQTGVLNISVDQVPSNIDMDVRVYNAGQQEIANSLGSGNGVGVCLKMLEAAGTYWLKLEDGSHDNQSSSQYTLCVTLDVSQTPFNTLVRGSISQIGDVDWYEFVIPHAGVVELRVDSVPWNIDMDVHIYDQAEQEIASSTGTGNGQSVYMALLKGPGSYWVKLEDGGWNAFSEFCYAFRVTLDTTDQYEINNTMVDARDIPMEQDVRAKIKPAGDADWFKFTIPQTGVLEVSVDSVPLLVDMDVFVYDYTGREVARSTGTGDGQDVFFMLLRDPGLHYILLREGNGDNYGNYSYILRLHLDATDPYEINNTMADARDIPMEQDVRAKIKPAGDTDWFKFTIPQTGVLEVSVDSVPLLVDMDVFVYDYTGREVGRSTQTGDGQDVFFMLLRDPGLHYILLREGNGDNYGNAYYILHLGLDTSDPYEINNTLADARLIQTNSLVRAKIRPTGDLDWFKFVPAGAESARITVDSVPLEIDMDVHVYDCHGSQIAASTGTGNGQPVALPVYLPVRDTYYLLLGDGDGGQSSTEFYELRVHE
jgi:hypothetical protein